MDTQTLVTAVAVTTTNGLLVAIGYGLRRTYSMIAKFAEQHTEMYEDFDKHAEIINLHTDVLVKSGWVKGRGIPRLDRRQKPREVTIVDNV